MKTQVREAGTCPDPLTSEAERSPGLPLSVAGGSQQAGNFGYRLPQEVHDELDQLAMRLLLDAANENLRATATHVCPATFFRFCSCDGC